MQSFCKQFEEAFRDCDDFIERRFADSDGRIYCAVFLDNLSDRGYISSSLILPIANKKIANGLWQSEVNISLTESDDFSEQKRCILDGGAVIFADGDGHPFCASVRSEEFRSIDNAGVEEVIRGPHDSFIEDGQTNVMLIRRRIRNEKLKCRNMTAGKTSKTHLYVLWLDGVCDEKIREKLMKRLEKCDFETVHDSGTVEHTVLDGKYSIFPLVGNTERPDKCAAKICEGRIAVIVDGSPVVLTVPYLAVEALQSADDYSKSPQYATFARILRFIGIVAALLSPAFYLAILEYHRESLPAKLLSLLATERESVPYGIFTELMLMLVIFDIIREVGQRMPSAMGSVVSIVAGIVLSDAALSSGLAGSPTMLLGAFCAACAYISPPLAWTNILLKYCAVICAELAGIFGIAVFLAFLCVYLCSKRSFGVPYLSPVSPFVKKGINDTLICIPR